jgi:hypothetical protein
MLLHDLAYVNDTSPQGDKIAYSTAFARRWLRDTVVAPVVTIGTGSRTIAPEQSAKMQKIGYGLLGLGVLVFVVWAGHEFLLDREVDPLIKVAVVAAVAGLLVLLAAVLRDRVRASKKDRFKGVER